MKAPLPAPTEHESPRPFARDLACSCAAARRACLRNYFFIWIPPHPYPLAAGVAGWALAALPPMAALAAPVRIEGFGAASNDASPVLRRNPASLPNVMEAATALNVRAVPIRAHVPIPTRTSQASESPHRSCVAGRERLRLTAPALGDDGPAHGPPRWPTRSARAKEPPRGAGRRDGRHVSHGDAAGAHLPALRVVHLE